MELGSSLRAHGYTACSNNHWAFLSNLLWLLLLMGHVLMAKAAVSPEGKHASLAFVKSPAEGFPVCKCPRHLVVRDTGGSPEPCVRL